MSPVLEVAARLLTCPRCGRPDVGSHGRIGSHCVLRADGDTRRRMPRCAGSNRWIENVRMRVSPLKVLGLRGQMSVKERQMMLEDAVAASAAVAHLSFNGHIVCIKWTGKRSYAWDCGPGGWSNLWKCYRTDAREHDGRFSLGRAVNMWRDMPSIKRAAAERQRQELAEDSPGLMETLKASLREEPADEELIERPVETIGDAGEFNG